MTRSKPVPPIPERHHLDKRVSQILDRVEQLPDDTLLDKRAVCEWLDVSEQFLSIARHRGYGPPFIRMSGKSIRYRAGDVRAWLKSRTHASTKEYDTSGVAGPGRPKGYAS